MAQETHREGIYLLPRYVGGVVCGGTATSGKATSDVMRQVSLRAGNWAGYRILWPNEADKRPGTTLRETVVG